MCSKSILKSLQRVPYVQTVEPDVAHSSFNITFKEGAVVNPDELTRAVQNAGFSVSSFIAVIRFNNVPVQKDSHIVTAGLTMHILNISGKVLQGDQNILFVDKNFLSTKEHKNYGKFTTMPCFASGTAEICCPGGKNNAKRIYHVTLK